MGWFVPIYNWTTDYAQGIGIRGDRHTAQDQRFTDGISASWCINPTVNGNNFTPTNPTVNLNMGGFRMTNAADGIGAQDFATVSQLTGNTSPVWGGLATGTANAITLTLTPALGAYAAGEIFEFIIATTNTGAVTININGLGAIAATKNGAQVLAAGDLVAGTVVSICHDGTRFQIISPFSGTNTQNNNPLYALAAGTANALTITLSPAPGFTVIPIGCVVYFTAALANTAAPNLTVNGIGPWPIYNGANPMVAGDLQPNQIYGCIFNSQNQWILLTNSPTGLNRNGATIYAVGAGLANAITATLSPVLTNAALTAGTTLLIVSPFQNTGATTISLSGGAAINVNKLNGVNLAAGDILFGQILQMVYTAGGYFQLLSPIANNVTTVNTSTELTGGPITSTGTIGVAAGIPIQTQMTFDNSIATYPSGLNATPLTTTINVRYNTSNVLIQYNVTFGTDDGNPGWVILQRDGNGVGNGAAAGIRQLVQSGGVTTGGSNITTVSGCFIDAAPGAGNHTYLVSIYNPTLPIGGNVYYNRSATDTNSVAFPRGSSTIIVQEVK